MSDSEATEPMPEQESGKAKDAPEGAAGGELADLIEAAEERASDSQDASGVSGAPSDADEESKPEPLAAEENGSAGPAAGDQSGSYIYPDGGAASSQRMRLVPPDGKPPNWRHRHRRELVLAEWILTGLFFLLALYFLFLWIFSGPAMACVPDPSWKMAADPGRWQAIVVHHTATDRSSPESIDRYHREVRKWGGLGYHFLIGNGRSNGHDPTLGDGAVFAGVRWREQRGGAHVRMKDRKNANSFSIGIALIGNFENSPPTPRQIAALRCLLGFLTEEYGIAKSAVHGHGEVSEKHTLCPGRQLPLAEIVATL